MSMSIVVIHEICFKNESYVTDRYFVIYNVVASAFIDLFVDYYVKLEYKNTAQK